MRNVIVLLFISLLFFVGCQQVDVQETDYPAKIAALEAELAYANQIISHKELQINNLQDIPKPIMELLPKVNKISLGRYSRAVDTDNNQMIDKIIIYLQVYDTSADLIKAAGAVSIELWDLNAPENNCVSRWELSSEQLEKSWDGGFLASHYRLELPVDDYRPAGQDLNLKCRFVEILTGKSWDIQKVVTQN